MAEEKKPAEQESAKTTAKPAARKKTTAAKAPAKTVQRVRKSAKKAEQAETKVELNPERIFFCRFCHFFSVKFWKGVSRLFPFCSVFQSFCT